MTKVHRHDFNGVLSLRSELSTCIRNMGIWFLYAIILFLIWYFVKIRKVHMGCVFKKKVENFI